MFHHSKCSTFPVPRVAWALRCTDPVAPQIPCTMRYDTQASAQCHRGGGSCTTQHSAKQYSAVQCSTMQRNTALRCNAMQCYSMVCCNQCYAAMQCNVMHRIKYNSTRNNGRTQRWVGGGWWLHHAMLQALRLYDSCDNERTNERTIDR